MKNYTIKQYESQDYNQWNAFIEKAKNATFLFHRDFMEYHSDRFLDCSLIVLKDEKLVSVIPANSVENEIFSHQGLTYGGFVFAEKINGNEVYEIFIEVLSYLKNQGFKKLFLKEIISIYNKLPSHEIGCFLIQKNAVLFRRDLNLVLDFAKLSLISKSKQKHFRKVSNLGLEIREELVFDNFWDKVLVPRLLEKHGSKPVHTKKEIKYLQDKFPENIIQYNCYFEDEIIAGITIFKFDRIIKSQYGATTLKGEKYRALDFLYFKLIEIYKNDFLYFDMGTVTENQGKTFNSGLLRQKEELGCSIYNQDFYEIIL